MVDEEKSWVMAMSSGVDAMRRYGGARLGMRTLLDALVPALQVLSDGASVGEAVDAAKGGMEATKTMQGCAGRANYVQHEEMLGVPDPGAYAVFVAFEAASCVYE